MIGMSSVITKKIKIKPGFIFAGNPAKKIAINKIGIKRKNVSKNDLKKEEKRFYSLIKSHPLYY